MGRHWFAVALIAVSSTATAQMSYRFKPQQKFSYDMEVTVDTDEETITYKGIIHYVVERADGNQATLNYQGGLTESKKPKNQARRGGFPLGPGGFGPPPIPSPFSRPAFAGKTQTTNKITLTSKGQTLAMEGDSQLPYLLGNVSLIPFEILPAGNERQWSSDTGVSITEQREDRRPFGRFGPMSPFGDNSPQSVQAGGELTNYSVASDDGNKVLVNKSYRLHTPKTNDNPAFEMVGSGTWTFDRQANVPQASEVTFSLKVSEGNSTTTIPIRLTYERISDQRLAEMEAEAKQKAEEMAAAAAEKKRLAETPLTVAETQAALAALASGDPATVRSMLNQLAEKSPSDPDPQIVAAIRPHLDSSDRNVQSAADKALTKWSADYAKVKRLEKEYQGPGALKSTDLYVESATPLFVGQIVQAKQPRHGPFWRAARVKRLLPDGTVELAFLTWGDERDVAAVGRRDIQLAPPELPQPARPESGTSTASTGPESRSWSDSTGKFHVQASYVSLENGTVRLQRTDGRTIAIPLEKLSEGDKAHVQSLQASENPFKLE